MRKYLKTKTAKSILLWAKAAVRQYIPWYDEDAVLYAGLGEFSKAEMEKHQFVFTFCHNLQADATAA